MVAEMHHTSQVCHWLYIYEQFELDEKWQKMKLDFQVVNQNQNPKQSCEEETKNFKSANRH